MEVTLNIFPKLAQNVDIDDEATPEQIAEAKRAEQKKHDRSTGPSRTRWLTNGQVRRMQTRTAKAEQRKTNRRYRRNWMATQQDLANLRGRLAVTVDPNVQAGMVELKGYGLVTPAESPLRRNAMASLTREFGEFDSETGELTNDPREAAQAVLGAANRARKA